MFCDIEIVLWKNVIEVRFYLDRFSQSLGLNLVTARMKQICGSTRLIARFCAQNNVTLERS